MGRWRPPLEEPGGALGVPVERAHLEEGATAQRHRAGAVDEEGAHLRARVHTPAA